MGWNARWLVVCVMCFRLANPFVAETQGLKAFGVEGYCAAGEYGA
jgi:hypothetical protein